MRRVRHLLVGLVTALAAVAAVLVPTFGTAHAESNGGTRVMPLGDSITDGLTVPGGYRIDLWQKVTSAGYQVDFVGSQSNGPSSLGDRDHEGHSGWTIAQIDANIAGWLRTYTPQTILLHIGTNDMYGSNPAGAPSRLSALIDRITAQSPDTEVFVSTIIPLSFSDATVRTYNAAIPGIVQSKVSAGKRVHLVDMYSALTTADLADGVHPNAGGYSKMATVWYNALRSVPGSIGDVTTPPTSPPPAPGACTATYKVVNSWGTGLQAEVTVRAGASAALNGWTVRMTLPAGQSIGSLWNGVNTGTTGSVSVKNAAHNAAVGAGASTTFGYVANGSATATPADVSCSSP
ncbi:cellulose binding domain-containing protein [Streptomyces blattellae]|uniref:cellulose binding domain-containing protein n=1 Tax=Streptomyces blattellae TaxID=2569855 RepID=UPI0018ACDD2A|nr:cellulose binding domain-containing protein [Streptomyces blattellae]